MTNNTLNLDDITSRIQQYVSKIKEHKADDTSKFSVNENQSLFSVFNDVRSNINKLDGGNKFNIQINNNEQVFASSDYAAEAYNHLNNLDDKQKVIIDFMHPNNNKFDFTA